MTSRIQRIAILAAMESEIAPIRRKLGLQRTGTDVSDDWTGDYRGINIISAVTRMGMESAEAATRAMFNRYGNTVDHVFVVGIAGAHDVSLDIGTVVTAAGVIDARDGILRVPASTENCGASGIIYSSDQLLHDPTFLDLLDRRNVTLIDMESGAIAAVCEQQGCPYSVIRAVSDRIDSNAATYEVFELANSDGSPRYLKALLYLLKKPWKIGYLMSLAVGSNKAITAATAVLQQHVENMTTGP